MTRWEFFTLEALDDIGMTQEGLEKILSDYVSVMDSFKNINVISPVSDGATQAYYDNYDNIVNNNNDHLEENPVEELTSIPKRSSSVSASTQPSLITETSTISSSSSTTTAISVTEQMMDIKKENKRKSFRISQQRRISWTSDTGLTSFAASQHLAGELMSLFDMEFNVEISVDPHAGTAPQLPELSYFQEKQNRNRSSVDSFMCLIPAFESFQIDNYDGYSYVSKANKRISTLSNGVNNKRLSSSLAPTRSSSLKYKNKPSSSTTKKSIHENINESYAKLNNNDPNNISSSTTSLLHDSQKSSTVDLQVHKTLTKKKSIRKLVSLFGKKKLSTNDSIPVESSTLKSASSSNLTSSMEPTSSLSASYSSSETNLNKPNLHVDTQFNINNNNPIRAYNQRPTNPPSLSDNIIYTNSNNSSIPETPFSSSPSSLSPNPNITVEEKKRRRRSNSVPDISTNKYHQQQPSIFEQSINNQSTLPTPTSTTTTTATTTPTTYQKDIPSSLSSSNITLIPTSSTSTATTSPIDSSDHYLTHSKSVYEFSTVPPRRKQSLSRSPTTYNVGNYSSSYNNNSNYNPHYYHHHQQHDPRLYHSTHDLSKLYTNDTGGIGNVLNDSKDSVLSPNDNKKSSLMSRMTSFARRKKPTAKQSVQV
ncbi:unnamed protein product [Cunninghamella blakesleeana]